MSYPRMIQTLWFVVALLVAAVLSLSAVMMMNSDNRPYCPTEDSCRADYRGGQWHVEPVSASEDPLTWCEQLTRQPRYRYRYQGAEISVPDGKTLYNELHADGSDVPMEEVCRTLVEEYRDHLPSSR